ncbi:amidohydrolase [Ornithinimicrobium sp. Y1694]|uniref:amidohydrolase n=1 Tax=Ornithinimicrobium sp. Y1694 TaxID=3418590 RepID=UPI003CF7D1C6
MSDHPSPPSTTTASASAATTTSSASAATTSGDLDHAIADWHAWLDAHPEPAWQEHQTTAYLMEQLAGLGLRTREIPDSTGGFAELGEGPRWIGLRADLDAIWMGDAEGGYGVHSCGHSAHMAMMLGAARLLTEESSEDPLPEGVGVRFLLQPAEETGTGALRLIEAGATDGMSHLFGMHLRPKDELPQGHFAPALHSGASLTGIVTITGEDAHGARPHQGSNAIDPLVAIHQVLPTLRFAPHESYSIKITRIRAGGASMNVIPGTAEVALDVRAQTNEVLEGLQERATEAIERIGRLYDVDVTTSWRDLTPAAQVDPDAAQVLAAAITEVAGADALAEEVVTPGGDDFHYYAYRQPELRSAMLAVPAQVDPGLHHPKMTYDTSVLPTGARILARAIRVAAQEQSDV